MRRWLGFVALLQLTAWANADEIQRRAPADPKGEVDIVNVAGEVTVMGWPRAEVEVTGELGAGVERLDFFRDGRRTVVKVITPSGRRAIASELLVRVPEHSALSINTVSADQRITGVRGAQRLQAVSGQITTETYGGEFEAQTVSGEVVVSGQGGAGPVRISTVSADVHASEIGADLELTTVTGDLAVHMGRLDRARIKSTNGNVDLSAALSDKGRIEAEAVNGDLRFVLHGAVNAQFDIETFNGDIENCFGPQPRSVREHGPGHELRFSEGAGTARVRIKTLNGAVEVCKK